MIRRAALGLSLAVMLFSAAAAVADTREVHGVVLPERVEVAGGEELQLNGAGTRTRFFVRVYVGALYTPETVTDGESALAMAGPRRVLLELLREVGRDTMVDALVEGLDGTMSDADRERLSGEIEAFRALFTEDFASGDRVYLDLVPGQGLVLTLNGEHRGAIGSEEFARFVFAIWLGDKPADRRLKRDMLEG